MQNAHRNTATRRSKTHETLFKLHGRSEHDLKIIVKILRLHAPAMKSVTQNFDRRRNAWNVVDTPWEIRPRFENEPAT